MMIYVYITYCDEEEKFRTFFRTGQQSDGQTDIVVYREVALPKIGLPRIVWPFFTLIILPQ